MSNLKSEGCPFIVARMPVNHFQIIRFFLTNTLITSMGKFIILVLTEFITCQSGRSDLMFSCKCQFLLMKKYDSSLGRQRKKNDMYAFPTEDPQKTSV